MARTALADVQKGTDVAEVKQTSRQGDTFGELLARYMTEHAEVKNKAGTLREKRKLAKALARLNPRMRLVITQRFGLDGQTPKTLEQVGSELGITRERVRQLESKSLRDLRSHAPELFLYLRTA